MKKNSIVQIFVIAILVLGFVGTISACSSKKDERKCIEDGCDNAQKPGSYYCLEHDKVYRPELYSSPEEREKENTSDSGTQKKTVNNSGSSGDSVKSTGSASYSNSTKSTGNTSHSNTSTYSGKKTSGSSSYDSYDEGYDAIYEDGDYDEDRYWSDSDYADGVDDAMDEFDEDW